jgi:uncharacterized membrane protein
MALVPRFWPTSIYSRRGGNGVVLVISTWARHLEPSVLGSANFFRGSNWRGCGCFRLVGFMVIHQIVPSPKNRKVNIN